MFLLRMLRRPLNRLQRIQREREIVLPPIYIKFYLQCFNSMPSKLVGTDLINNSTDLLEGAIELLEENGIPNFLKKDDFVFMMHQGYMFYYFQADGSSNPTVYGYYEGKPMYDNMGSLSEFIKDLL